MARFVLKSQLNQSTQDEISRIQAVPAGQRNSEESAFLVALGDYLYNDVILSDANGLIIIASGITVPTGTTGFKKGAVFIKNDESGDGRYYNNGDEVSSLWGATGSPSPSASASPSASLSPSASASPSA